MYKADTKGLEKLDDAVKGTYISLSCTLVVVISAVNGITVSPAAVVDVICSLYPKTYFGMPMAHLVFVSIPGRGTIPFFLDDLYYTWPFVFKRLLSIAVIEGCLSPIALKQKDIPLLLSCILYR